MKKSTKEELDRLRLNEDDGYYIKMNKLFLAFNTIQRLMPEVEAELFRLSAVGGAHGKKQPKEREEMEIRIKKQFNSTTKIKS